MEFARELAAAPLWKIAAHVIDLVLVTIIFYKIYIFLRGSRAYQLIRGIFIVIVGMGVIYLLSSQLGIFLISGWIVRHLTVAIIVAIPIVFQPELRRALEYIGSKHILTPTINVTSLEITIEEIIKAVQILSLKKYGSLIVLERLINLKEYTSQGVQINSDVHAELIVSIFLPTSPLHDGALIIKNDKIVAARCVMPVSREMTPGGEEIGLRHRAALGITEETDCLAIVVSEENGSISISHEGRLMRFITPLELRDILRAIYQVASEPPN
ncbi:MAG: Cyclic di-AMP synthase CdaA [candidate division WS2 bacterium]|uniref:Diadenylate cyclase n=1 Tax=Psychracetigena formicireducens TaxID=2986056 RepID=A0A9E2BK39_PSYF1|nr:Cyclic di-AMP synthase CdaA [Candidatus Psychracetigena formicireducens]MBT9144549.1 Cyclic di-AMP synthase CdaA [Candidatus Psychracetigena formicireducens]MBT9149852.1 Cyclic di-AMP synthase CdaA [Candidatus Psychracetigena formicireducens]